MQKTIQLCVGSLAILSVVSANADIIYEGHSGQLVFGGDVELDINAYNTQSGPIFTEESIEANDEYNQTGRILLEVSGERKHHGNFARFKVQPLMQTDGTFGLDDAWLGFGDDTGLTAKVGRFEAFDLFPLGQDVFVEYNGNTSDSLYSDGQGYIYQVKEGRGRASDAGQVMIAKTSGDLYAEVSTLFGDRTDLFQGDTYHGFALQDDTKNAFTIRPVVAWTPGPLTLAAGAETNLVDDAIVDERGEDISDRTGYGTRLSYGEGPWSINANLAYMDAPDEENLTLGLNMIWHQFGLGYIHARNEIRDVKAGSAETSSGDYEVDTLYTSYRFPEIMGIENFDIYLGAYYSQIDHEAVADLDEADRYGGRLRFKYLF